MRNYELVVIFDSSLEEEAVDKELSKITSLIEKEKCTVSNVDRWGIRKLAHPIKGKESGNYLIIYFEGNSGIVSELDRVNKINDKILRHLIVKSDQS